MAPPSLRRWLQTFIRHEVGKAIEWETDRRTRSGPSRPNVAGEEEEQLFEDDGSNFRSHVPNLAPGKDLVQLIEVLSLQDEFAEVRVSDGHVRVKARLARDIVVQWESEAGEPLELDTRGDVLKLQQLVVVSTSFGHPDGFVWLDIKRAEYCHHLRKLCGSPLAINQDPHIQLLVQDIADLRREGLGAEEQSHKQEDRSPPLEDHHGAHTEQFETQQDTVQTPMCLHSSSNPGSHLEGENQHILSTAKLVDQPASSEQRGNPPAGASATSPWNRKASEKGTMTANRATIRRAVPQLESDGFEIQQGVNLSGPVQAEALSGNVLAVADDSSAEKKRMKLLNLLRLRESKKRPFDPALVEQSSTQQIDDPEIISETPARPRKTRRSGSPEPVSNLGAASNRSPGPRKEPQDSAGCRQDAQSWTGNTIIPDQIESQQIATADSPAHDGEADASADGMDVTQARDGPVVTSPDKPSAASVDGPAMGEKERIEATAPLDRSLVIDQQSAVLQTSAPKQFEMDAYNAKRIPKNQMKVLAAPSSWYPSLPGKEFPRPNLPIELLTQWHEQRKLWPADEEKDTTEDRTAAVESGSNETAPSSPASEDLVSEWASSPISTRRAGTPPDSSPPKDMREDVHTNDLEIAPPRALALREPSSRRASELRVVSPPRRHPQDAHLERRRRFFSNNHSNESFHDTAKDRDVDDSDEAFSAFHEYHQSFKKLRPGGFWARQSLPAHRKQVDVLRWET